MGRYGPKGFARKAQQRRMFKNESVLHVELRPGDRLYQKIAGDYAIIELRRDGKTTRIYSIVAKGRWGDGNRIFRTLLAKLAQVGNEDDQAWVAERVLDFDADPRFATGQPVSTVWSNKRPPEKKP